MADPAETIRLLGRKMGLWKHGFDFPRACRQLFRDVTLRNKTMLEIGCGKGTFCLWAGLQGAREVVGLEPLADGAYDSIACHKDFITLASTLGLPQARILPCTIQSYDGGKNNFDLVLSVASINHLDEKSCIQLRKSPKAAKSYVQIFRRVAQMMKPGGKLLIMDAARENFFGDRGLRNPMSPNIEWFKHQQPEEWAALLHDCGFRDARIRWCSGRLLRYAGIMSLPKILSYFGLSAFRLEMTRSL